MKGKLQKIDDKWFVAYKMEPDLIATDGGLVQLHPDDVKQLEEDSLVFDNIEARVAAYPEVNFYFKEVWKQVDGETNITRYAKLGEIEPYVSDNFQIGPDGAYEHEESDDYPELEGTNALCEDIIEKRKEERNKIVKLSEEEWVECDGCDDNDKYFWIKGFIAGKSHNEIPEISDEEIEKSAKEWYNKKGIANYKAEIRAWVSACKWYREQLKQKQ